MVKIVHVDDNGAEMAAIELDEFTVEILYSGIAKMLQDAASTRPHPSPPIERTREARQRRNRILTRIQA